MIDPLDGTRGFTEGRDNFSINIGLVENGVPILGFISIPAQGKIVYAEKMKGSFEKKGDQFYLIYTSDVKEIKNARHITRETRGDTRLIEEKISVLQFSEKITGGSVGDKLFKIASGVADTQINTNNGICKWDTAAGQIILEEAGGVISDLDGKPIDYKSDGALLGRSYVASANVNLHAEVIRELQNFFVHPITSAIVLSG